MKVLITGASGQDATHLGKILEGNGDQVYKIGQIAMDGDSKPELLYFKLTDEIIREPKRFLNEHKFDVIFHTAAISSPRICEEDPVKTHEINVRWVDRILSAVLGTSTKVIFFGSGSVFGNQSSLQSPFVESSPLNAKGVYANSKAQAMEIVRQYRRQGVWATSLILFNHESLNRRGDYLFPVLCRKIADAKFANSKIEIRNKYDIADWGIAHDYMLAAVNASMLEYPRDIILATGQSRSVGELTASLCQGFDGEDAEIVSIGKERKNSIFVDPSVSFALLGQYNQSNIVDLGINQIKLHLMGEF